MEIPIVGASQKHWEVEAKIGVAKLSEHLTEEVLSVSDKQGFFLIKAQRTCLTLHKELKWFVQGWNPPELPELNLMQWIHSAVLAVVSSPCLISLPSLNLPVFDSAVRKPAEMQMCGILALVLFSPVFLPTAGAAEIQKKGVGEEGGTVLEAACTFYR